MLRNSRLRDVEYYSFNEESPDTYVYYIQLEGWLYGRGHGNLSKVLKTYKPYIGNSNSFTLFLNFLQFFIIIIELKSMKIECAVVEFLELLPKIKGLILQNCTK